MEESFSSSCTDENVELGTLIELEATGVVDGKDAE